jgi:hypothetical protein
MESVTDLIEAASGGLLASAEVGTGIIIINNICMEQSPS